MRIYELFERGRSIGLYFTLESAQEAMELTYDNCVDCSIRLNDYDIIERTAK